MNIEKNSKVSVEMSGGSFAAEARITQGREHSELYDKVVAKNARFARYLGHTAREIPVIALRRA